MYSWCSLLYLFWSPACHFLGLAKSFTLTEYQWHMPGLMAKPTRWPKACPLHVC